MVDEQKLNIVDENDNIIDQETRQNIHKQGLLHREIYVLIYNRKGEILFQERSITKDTSPGLLGASVGGHVEIGDDYKEAAIRELEEETGIKADLNKLKYLAEVKRKSYDQLTGMTNDVIRAVYVYQDEAKDIKIEEGEATGFEFWSLEDLLDISEQDRKRFTPSMLSDQYISIYKKIKKLPQ